MFSISKCVHFTTLCLILAMLYAYAALILTALIFIFILLSKRGASLHIDCLNTAEHLHSLHNSRLSGFA